MSASTVAPSVRTILLALLILSAALLSSPGCRKEPEGPDLSTPKSAALAFTAALESGDVETARRASNSAGIENELLAAMAESAAGVKKLGTAAAAKFGGNAANQIIQQQSLSVTKNLINGEVEQTETRATVRSRDGRDTVALKKDGKVWRVDMGALIQGKDITHVVPYFRAQGLAAREVAAEIDAGRLPTIDAARREMGKRLVTHLPQLVRKQYEASTKPAPDLDLP